MIDDGGELWDRHLESAVAADGEYQFVGTRKLCADGRGQSESHGAQPARVEPQTRLIEADKLGCPHLMLAYIGSHDSVAAAETIDFPHQMLRLDFAGRDFGSERMLLPPVANLGPPRLARRGIPLLMGGRQFAHHFVQFLQDALYVAHDGQVGGAILADLGWIDVDVNYLGMRSERR